MKLLKIEADLGYFLASDGTYLSIEKITKEDLIRLVDAALEKEDAVIDSYDEKALKNQAHQIIYKSIAQKLLGLIDRKKGFKDESSRLYLKEYERYSTK